MRVVSVMKLILNILLLKIINLISLSLCSIHSHNKNYTYIESYLINKLKERMTFTNYGK
jgi:hypothetical protein